MNVEARALQTNETDDRGRIYLGPEYANERVTVAVVEVETDRSNDQDLAAAYQDAAASAEANAEEWDETAADAWSELPE